MDDNFSDDSSSFIVLLMAKDDGSHYNDGHGWSCGNYSDGGVFDLSFFCIIILCSIMMKKLKI